MGRKYKFLGLDVLSEIIIISLFLLALVVPGISTLFSSRSIVPETNVQTPAKNLTDYYTHFKDQFQQSIGIRPALIDMHTLIKSEWLGVSPSRNVLYGKDGWLFYSDDNEISCSRHSQFNEMQLEQWASVLDARRSMLEKKGIHYIFFVAPCKHTVYPEYLPSIMVPVKPQSRTDQLVDYVRKHTSVQILDIRPALINAKSIGQLYYKTDTHWNTLGAFIAYQQFMGQVQTWYPDIKLRQLSDYSIKDAKFSGDLYAFLGIHNGPSEDEQALILKFKSSTRFISDAGELIVSPRIRIDSLSSTNPVAQIPKLVMFRDSFGTALLPYVADHFKNAVYLWKSFDASVIDKEKPDVVIEELVERDLLKDLPSMP